MTDKYSEIVGKKLEDIKNNPKKHQHSFDGLMSCCMVLGAIDSRLMDAHSTGRTNGGVSCDVTSGPCACGAWH